MSAKPRVVALKLFSLPLMKRSTVVSLPPMVSLTPSVEVLASMPSLAALAANRTAGELAGVLAFACSPSPKMP